MCTAVRIVVAAAERDRRLELRRATVTAEWEVVGEAAGPEAAYREAVERRARFLVLDSSAAGPRPQAIAHRLKSTNPDAFVIGVGEGEGMDATLDGGDIEKLRTVMAELLHTSGDHQH